MDKQEILQVPESVQQAYEAYHTLNVPYYRAKHGKSIRKRIHKGKGSITEIKAALEALNEEGTPYEILEKHHIGIDCSGLVMQLYDIYTMENLHTHAWEFFKRKTLNPLNLVMFHIQPIVSKINADTLTSTLNTKKITSVKDAKPLDLIRMNGGKHVAMIYKIYKRNGIVEKIEYIQSTEGVGVCHGFVTITDQNKSITSQTWESLPDHLHPIYEPADLIKYKINDNGIRRPLFLA